MSISIERYVSITSGVIGAQSVAQRELVGLRFSTDPRTPVGSQVVVTSAGDALNYYGPTSAEYAFAAQYFSYTSPAPASRPERLRFAAFANTARPARVFGAKVTASLDEFKAVTAGALNITINNVDKAYTNINFSAATSFANIATTLQTLLVADYPGTTVTYDAVAGVFNLVTTTTGNANIVIMANSLAQMLGWGTTGIASPGSPVQSPLEALRAAEQVTDSFGSFSFGTVLQSTDVVALAQYNASLNIKYMYLQSVTPASSQALSAAVIGIKSLGLVLNGTAGQYKEAIPQAIMAATNYRRRNATVNYMYRQVGGMTADVTTDALANTYDGQRVNYYGETANAGQKIAFFQRAFLTGGATDPLDMGVHANEQWLKAYLTSLLLSLQLSKGSIPANNEGRGYVIAQVVGAADLAKFNGTILPGKTLTVAQQISVTQLTGDPDAWRQVQANGFWADARVVERTGETGLTEYEIQYTLCYAKNDVVRKISGSHSLV